MVGLRGRSGRGLGAGTAARADRRHRDDDACSRPPRFAAKRLVAHSGDVSPSAPKIGRHATSEPHRVIGAIAAQARQGAAACRPF